MIQQAKDISWRKSVKENTHEETQVRVLLSLGSSNVHADTKRRGREEMERERRHFDGMRNIHVQSNIQSHM